MEFSLVNGQLDLGKAAVCFPFFSSPCFFLYQQPCRQGPCSVLQREPLFKLLDCVLWKSPLYPCKICLVHMLFGREKAVGQLPVIGNQQKALCVYIQSSHRKEVSPLCILNQAHHGLMAAVLCSRHHAGRLVEHKIFIGSVAYLRSVQGHLTCRRLNLSLRFPADFSIHAHSSAFYHFLDLAPASLFHLYQIAIQAHGLLHHCHLHPG